MKRLLVALALVLAVAGTVLAKPIAVQTCTADGKKVVLSGELTENASDAVAKNVSEAFIAAANALPVDELISAKGFRLFVAGLTEESKQNFEIPEPPKVLEGSCKVKK